MHTILTTHSTWGTTIHTALHDLHTAHMQRNSHVLLAVVMTKAAIYAAAIAQRHQTRTCCFTRAQRRYSTMWYCRSTYCCMHPVHTTHSTHGAPHMQLARILATTARRHTTLHHSSLQYTERRPLLSQQHFPRKQQGEYNVFGTHESTYVPVSTGYRLD